MASDGLATVKDIAGKLPVNTWLIIAAAVIAVIAIIIVLIVW